MINFQNQKKAGYSAQQNQEKVKSKQQESTNSSKRSWRGMKEFILNQQQSQDLEDQIDILGNKLDTYDQYKIKLILRTNFKNDAEAKKFFLNMVKWTNKQNIYYLDWEIRGNFTEEVSIGIGDLIGKFSLLYSLNLNIYGGSFEEYGSLSLVRGFKSLKNLHALRLYDYSLQQKLLLKDKNRMMIIKGAQEIRTLEILNSNITLHQQLQPLTENHTEKEYDSSTNKLSTFVYLIITSVSSESFRILDLTSRQALDNFKQSLMKNLKRISHLHFIEEDSKSENQQFKVNKRFFENQLIQCFLLPYLTSFEISTENLNVSYINKQFDFKFPTFKNLESFKIVKIAELLFIFLQEKKTQIMQIVSFNLNLSNYFSFNPKWVLNDLYFD